MSRLEYELRMAWAAFWCKILGIYQFFYIPDNCNGVYGWILSQCGFCYVGSWEQCQDFYSALEE